MSLNTLLKDHIKLIPIEDYTIDNKNRVEGQPN